MGIYPSSLHFKLSGLSILTFCFEGIEDSRRACQFKFADKIAPRYFSEKRELPLRKRGVKFERIGMSIIYCIQGRDVPMLITCYLFLERLV